MRDFEIGRVDRATSSREKEKENKGERDEARVGDTCYAGGRESTQHSRR